MLWGRQTPICNPSPRFSLRMTPHLSDSVGRAKFITHMVDVSTFIELVELHPNCLVEASRLYLHA